MAHYIVILYVDTDNIEQKYIDLCCNFGQAPTTPNKDFRTYMDPGDTITWLGLSRTNPKDRVDIKYIQYDGLNNIFGKSKIEGDHGKPEMVNGKVLNQTHNENESYKIVFEVFNDRKPPNKGEYYHIDPRIKVNP